ncbi:MAG: glycosyltransferase family 2 protein [Oscillospiraceae bacterium]|nr:glycosyltransferase family 2 protein [Oscillospiraceae bacterium]
MCKALTKLYLAIPCYNEEEVLPDSAQKLLKKYDDLAAAGKITADSRIIFIDDGSKDRTWELIEELHNSDNRFGGIKMSRNRGHQNALLGGLMTLRDKADAVISLDADLQDDIDAIDGMLEKYEEGYDVVYGVRSSREKDSFFKRFTAEGYYKVLDKMGAKIVFNHADFRLMSARALESFSEFHEVNIFLRGLVPMVGYKSTIVEYERKERLAGESKYPLKKMLALALEGITSLSVKPLRFITGLGVMAFMVSVIMLIYFLVRYFTGHTIVGWASLAVSIWALGGLQLLSMGILGEYLGKIYLETKQRPRFIVETYLNDEE